MQISKLRLAAFAVVFAILFSVIGAGTALAVQGHMLNARSDLNSALNELNAATANKGGYRANAINLVRQAINQVNLGIEYAS
ncbi:MAG: hypothetical protein WB681_09800 [Candidatus Cybelea sp.]|jgi:hypothetical protein|nr:hypothetical protein [Candidatus Cybelea sp.]